MDTNEKAKGLNEVSGIISILKLLKSNKAMAAELVKTPATAAELLDFQIDALELFLAVGGALEIMDKEIKELKARLQKLELTPSIAHVSV